MSKGKPKSINKANNKKTVDSTKQPVESKPEEIVLAGKNAGKPGPAAKSKNQNRPKVQGRPAKPNDQASLTYEAANPTRLPQATMEVHHHPQLNHKRKPFKEYLLEGFMIFIAVLMGFIAENIRESISDNEHVKQLTAQLVQDLNTTNNQRQMQ